MQSFTRNLSTRPQNPTCYSEMQPYLLNIEVWAQSNPTGWSTTHEDFGAAAGNYSSHQKTKLQETRAH